MSPIHQHCHLVLHRLLSSLLLRAYIKCTTFISQKQIIEKKLINYTAIRGNSFSISRLIA